MAFTAHPRAKIEMSVKNRERYRRIVEMFAFTLYAYTVHVTPLSRHEADNRAARFCLDGGHSRFPGNVPPSIFVLPHAPARRKVISTTLPFLAVMKERSAVAGMFGEENQENLARLINRLRNRR